MNKKRNTWLLMIFTVLLLIALWPYFEGHLTNVINIRKQNILDIEFIKENKTTQINLSKGKETLTLDKSSGFWKVASYSASIKKIEDLLNELKKSDDIVLVSKNKNSHRGYGLAEDNMTKLKIIYDNREKILYIGNSGPEIGSYYINVPGDDRVYLIRGLLLDHISLSVSDWRDKTVINTSGDLIKSIEIKGIHSIILSLNNDNKWEIIYNGKSKTIEDSDISLIMENLSFLEADDFIDSEELVEFENASKELINITLNDNSTINLQIYSKDDSYLIKNDNDSEVLKVNKYKLKDLMTLFEKTNK